MDTHRAITPNCLKGLLVGILLDAQIIPQNAKPQRPIVPNDQIHQLIGM